MKRNDNKNNVDRIANILMKQPEKCQVIGITSLSVEEEEEYICELLSGSLRERGKEVLVLNRMDDNMEISAEKNPVIIQNYIEDQKEKCDVIIIATGAADENACSVAMAGICDKTILVVKKEKISGNQAMRTQRELEMSGASILGAVFVR